MNYAAAIIFFPKFNTRRAILIFSHFNSAKNIWDAELNELVRAGIEEQIADEFIHWREKISVEKITEELRSEDIKTTSLLDSDYPFLLRQITDPPPLLFYRGTLPSLEINSVSVVGTRRCTSYGKLVTNAIAGELAANRIVVVSGLALGIDGEAHQAALQNNGITVAVLGTGIDKRSVYPRAHFSLAEKIIEKGGAIISEYPPGFEPTQYSFPARNRIIAGLSLGTLITEAPASSGALITARYCLDYNREVFAVPHPINSKQGEGCNLFIKKGAQLVTSAAEILESLQIEQVKKPSERASIQADNLTEEKIFSLLNVEPKHINEIIKQTGLASNVVTSALTLLEMKGAVRNLGGMMYELR